MTSRINFPPICGTLSILRSRTAASAPSKFHLTDFLVHFVPLSLSLALVNFLFSTVPNKLNPLELLFYKCIRIDDEGNQ